MKKVYLFVGMLAIMLMSANAFAKQFYGTASGSYGEGSTSIITANDACFCGSGNLSSYYFCPSGASGQLQGFSLGAGFTCNVVGGIFVPDEDNGDGDENPAAKAVIAPAARKR